MLSIQSDAVPRDITSHVPFLARAEIYKTEKPYAADFPVEEVHGANITNHVFDIVPVTFHDVRYRKESLNLDDNGVCFIKAATSLQAEEATIERTPAMEQYAQEIIAILRERFPHYVEIQFMDFQVRKRSPAFPNGHKQKKVDYAQPATVPHTDFSRRGAYLRMKDVFPEQEEQHLHRQFDLINVWRVLKGPNDDWPLAVCDFSTIDVEKDTTTNDALHLTRMGENLLLHPSDAHRWYYLSGMEEDDLIIFRNTNSSGKLSHCFHVAFNNPSAEGGLRHSVEIRLVAFRDGQL